MAAVNGIEIFAWAKAAVKRASLLKAYSVPSTESIYGTRVEENFQEKVNKNMRGKLRSTEL